jgi:hypothetical protein
LSFARRFLSIFSIFRQPIWWKMKTIRLCQGLSVACVIRLLLNSGLRVFISSKQVTRARFSCPLEDFVVFSIFRQPIWWKMKTIRLCQGLSVACVIRLLLNSGLRVFISSKQVTKARFSCAIEGFRRLRGVFINVFNFCVNQIKNHQM